ncbi:MAG TPA: hypothetical protein VHT70_05730 [Candidatus Saccharimonadales bacterium]|nr:hypothetical protein [Candidatus Saccharimonadales bacterium]
MSSEIYRFAGEPTDPVLSISPMIDNDLNTLEGAEAANVYTRATLRTALEAEITESDPLRFHDVEEGRTFSLDTLLDRYADITEIPLGTPTVKYIETPPDKTADEMNGVDTNVTDIKLQRFYDATGLQPRMTDEELKEVPDSEGTWGGRANKFTSRIEMPTDEPRATSFLHEIGHLNMHRVSLNRTSETKVDEENDTQYTFKSDYWPISGGLQYEANGEVKGTILEEAVAEGLGKLVNNKLHLVRPSDSSEQQRLPEMVAPYILDNCHSNTAPAAVALELIAKELGIPPDRYFRMFVDYANAGVQNTDARAEIAETIYRGTHGRLTLGQVEELPYPVNRPASLALLWAVEDALEVPDHQRYADLFFKDLPEDS